MRGGVFLVLASLPALAPDLAFALDKLATEGAECAAFGAAFETSMYLRYGPGMPAVIDRDRKMWADLIAATRGSATDEELAAAQKRVLPEFTVALNAFHANAPAIPGTDEDPSVFVGNVHDACDAMLKRFGLGEAAP